MNRMNLMIIGGLVALSHASVASAAVDKKDVLTTYSDIAHAKYEDSLMTAKDLQAAVKEFLAKPTEANLAAAKDAWRAARVPYQQTEGYRFGNAIVDDWEGKVNAWPLDEGLIDYVDGGNYGEESDENPFYTANLVANEKLLIGGEEIDATEITKVLLSDKLHEIDDVEANVATGYHAVEFMLWGQDLNGTGPGAGARPASDYDPNNCTGGNCERRAQYLKAVTNLLVDDLGDMVANWALGGEARQGLLEGDADAGIATILTGLGSLSYGELAGERMKLGLMLHDPEEEHDCFSDNTHWSHYYNQVGMRNIYTGRYVRVDGSTVEGPSVSDLAQQASSGANAELLAKLDATDAAMKKMVETAEGGKAYDQMLADGDDEGNQVLDDVVNALKDQTKAITGVVAALQLQSIDFEGSDSLDNPNAVMTQ